MYFYSGNYPALSMANKVAGLAEDKERKSGAFRQKTTRKTTRHLQLAFN